MIVALNKMGTPTPKGCHGVFRPNYAISSGFDSASMKY
jgi:hypothetical protein